MSAAPEPRHVRVQRLLPAPVDDVFAAWTDAASLARWMSPTGHAEIDADVRVGGSLRVVMVGEGSRIEHTGEFLAVDPPHRLSFTWQSPYTAGPSVVTVTLTPVPGGTRLVLVHERLPEEVVEPHAGGWTAILENLERVLAARAADES